MKLTELFLNRFLYRESLQNLETKDSVYNSGNVKAEAPVPIASGGAAEDINTGNVEINGMIITPGTYPQTVLDVSNWGWGQTGAFTSATLNTVTWGTGTFTSASGESYAISAGTTGAMAVKTYIYLDLLASTTAYQTTTNPALAVGIGKVLIGVANPDSVSATYNLSEATQLVGDNILANSINASKIMTGQLIVGTNVGLGTAQTAGQVTTIIGNTVTTGFVYSLDVTAQHVVANISISSPTITGGTITAKNGATEIATLDSGGLKIYGEYATWYNTTPTAIAEIYANGTQFMITNFGVDNGSIFINGYEGLYLNSGGHDNMGVYLQYGTSTKLSIDTNGVTLNSTMSCGTNNISGIGTATATTFSVGGSSNLTYSSSKLQISTDTYVSGTLACSGALECGTARIRIGTTDFYVTADPNSPGNYYLRT